VPQSAPAPATKIGPSARPRGLRDDMAPWYTGSRWRPAWRGSWMA